MYTLRLGGLIRNSAFLRTASWCLQIYQKLPYQIRNDFPSTSLIYKKFLNMLYITACLICICHFPGLVRYQHHSFCGCTVHNKLLFFLFFLFNSRLSNPSRALKDSKTMKRQRTTTEVPPQASKFNVFTFGICSEEYRKDVETLHHCAIDYDSLQSLNLHCEQNTA